MNKNSFIRACSKRCGKGEKELENVFETMKECLLEALCQGREVKFLGVGKFFVRVLPPKTIINNFTHKETLVMQRFRVVFKTSKKFSEQIK